MLLDQPDQADQAAMCHGLIPLSGLLRTVWHILISNCIVYSTAWPSCSWYILVEQAGKCRPHLKRLVPTANFPASVSVSLIFPQSSTICPLYHPQGWKHFSIQFSVIQHRGQFPFFSFSPLGPRFRNFWYKHFLHAFCWCTCICLYVSLMYVCL